MNKYRINELSVFEDILAKKYFVGFFVDELKNIIQDLNGTIYEKMNSEKNIEQIKLIRSLVYYYPEPAFKCCFEYEIIKGRKVAKLPKRLVADNTFITREAVLKFEENELTKIVKKESKLIESGKLIPTEFLKNKEEMMNL